MIESGVEFRRLGVVRASKSVLGMRTPRLIWRKENSVIDREIVEINEIAHVVGNDVEVPRDPLHSSRWQEDRGDGYLEPSAAKLDPGNRCSQHVQYSGYLLSNGLGTEGISERLQRQKAGSSRNVEL